MPNGLRFFWPWCGWFGKHRFVFLRKLTILGEGKCANCGMHFLYNRFEEAWTPWSERHAEFFARREARP